MQAALQPITPTKRFNREHYTQKSLGGNKKQEI